MVDAHERDSRKSWLSHGLALFLGLAISFIIAWAALPTREASIRGNGGFLQLLGLCSIALGISQLRREYGLPDTVSEIVDEAGQRLLSLWHNLLRRLGRKPTPTIVVTATSTAGWASTRGRAKVRPGADSTAEQRVALLEQLVDNIQDAVWKLEEDLAREVDQRARDVTSERQGREQVRRELEVRLKELAVGGIRLQTIGVVWLFLGVILATWSQELARAF